MDKLKIVTLNVRGLRGKKGIAYITGLKRTNLTYVWHRKFTVQRNLLL